MARKGSSRAFLSWYWGNLCRSCRRILRKIIFHNLSKTARVEIKNEPIFANTPATNEKKNSPLTYSILLPKETIISCGSHFLTISPLQLSSFFMPFLFQEALDGEAVAFSEDACEMTECCVFRFNEIHGAQTRLHSSNKASVILTSSCLSRTFSRSTMWTFRLSVCAGRYILSHFAHSCSLDGGNYIAFLGKQDSECAKMFCAISRPLCNAKAAQNPTTIFFVLSLNVFMEIIKNQKMLLFLLHCPQGNRQMIFSKVSRLPLFLFHNVTRKPHLLPFYEAIGDEPRFRMREIDNKNGASKLPFFFEL